MGEDGARGKDWLRARGHHLSYRHNFLVCFFTIKCCKTFCRTELDMSLYHHNFRKKNQRKNAYDHNLSYTKSYFRNTHWTLIKHWKISSIKIFNYEDGSNSMFYMR